MELFRTISPNGGSISAIHDTRATSYGGSPQQSSACPSSGTATSTRRIPARASTRVHWKEPNGSTRNGI